MTAFTTVICGNKDCKKSFEARAADISRGWGKFCSKSCKATHQTKLTGISGPHYKADGVTVAQMARGKYSKSQFQGRGKRSAPANGIFRNGVRMTCEWCGDWATNGIISNLSHHKPDPIHGYPIEWCCDRHFDESHPFDSDAAGFNNT